MKKDLKKRVRKKFVAPKTCAFCKEAKEPNYFETETLSRFISERGKILAAARSGLCQKHQGKLTLAIKHARHLALLPFVGKQ